jgi:hypothetical protein
MTGYCGIDCNTCECFIATEKDDDRMRMNVAIKWSKLFKRTILPREINCTGCLSDGVQFENCNVCKIKNQQLNKKIVNG